MLEKGDVVLDAACGLGHPFKFHLAEYSEEVYACDIDERILSEQAILDDIEKDFGEEALKESPLDYSRRIRYSRSDLTSLPYGDNMFDKIFCISVLEHLKDSFNRYPLLLKIPWMKDFFHQDILRSLKEFRRTLKRDGLIVLTFDYPDINLEYLKEIVPAAGLQFAGPAAFDIPENALYSEELEIFCYRAALVKNESGRYEK